MQQFNAQPQQTGTKYDKIRKIPTDIVSLPSEGVFYKGGESTVMFEYMTGKDENILSSPNLIKSGQFLNVLLEQKIKSPWVKVDELLPGDKNAIINALRVTAYGSDYVGRFIDPSNNEEFDYKIDLTKLTQKPLGATPDEKFEFSFKLPITGDLIKFKLLNSKEYEEVYNTANNIGKIGGITPTFTTRIKKQIMEADGERDPFFIDEYVDSMLPRDAHELLNYINKIEPDLLLEADVVAPSGERFRGTFTFDILEYLFPFRGK